MSRSQQNFYAGLWKCGMVEQSSYLILDREETRPEMEETAIY